MRKEKRLPPPAEAGGSRRKILMEQQNRLRQISVTLSPYLILGVFSLVLFMMQFRIGFDLGYWADILKSRYVFHDLGTRAGLEWITFIIQRRHLLSSFQHMLFHVLSPDHAGIWYGSTILTHYLLAFPLFLLSDTMLRGKARWLSLGAALFAITYDRQFFEFYEFSTRAFLHVALILQILSFWFYVLYVRSQRMNIWWRDLAIFNYFLALNLYETTALYFVLYPLLAYLEDWRNGYFKQHTPLKWLVQLINDLIWMPVLMVLYLAFLMLFLPSNEISTSFANAGGKILNVLRVEWDISLLLARLQPALMGTGLLMTAALFVLFFMGGALWYIAENRSSTAGESNDSQSDMQRAVGVLLLLGLGMMVLNLMLAVQVSLLPPPVSVRTIYPFVAGSAFALFALLYFFIQVVPMRWIQAGFVGFIIAVNVAPAPAYWMALHQDYATQNDERNQILNAIMEAVPEVPRQATPYFLIFTDEASNEAVYSTLRAGDFNFPRWFEMAYNTNDFGVDVVRYDLPPPDPDTLTPEEIRRGGTVHIIAAEDGIYSTLRAAPLRTEYAPNPPSDLIIIRYDHETGIAELVDEAPAELLEIANIVELAPVEWRTNYDLLNAE